MKNQKGYTHWVIAILISVMAVGLVGVAWWYEENKKETTTTNEATSAVNTNIAINSNTNANITVNKNTNTVVNTNTIVNTNTVTNTNVDTSGWETYTNTTLGFSLQYPAGWTLVETSSGGDAFGQVISIQSPEAAEMEKNGLNLGYSKDVVVYFWSSINNEYARGGSWIGQREYSSLIDYFTDEQAPFIKKVSEITVSGLPAYEVSIGGAGLAYGVMVENDGIYEIAFLTAWDKAQLSSTQQMILSTFSFTE